MFLKGINVKKIAQIEPASVLRLLVTPNRKWMILSLSPGNIWQCLETVATGTEWAENRDYAKQCTIYRTTPTHQELCPKCQLYGVWETLFRSNTQQKANKLLAFPFPLNSRLQWSWLKLFLSLTTKTAWLHCKETGECIINSMRSSNKLERLGSRDQAEEFALDRRGPSCPGSQWERGNHRRSSAIYLMQKLRKAPQTGPCAGCHQQVIYDLTFLSSTQRKTFQNSSKD